MQLPVPPPTADVSDAPVAAAARPAPVADGWRVVVTRPAAQAGPWVADLRAAGVDAVALPLIEIGAAADPAAVAEAWHTLAGVDLVFFVSANAVDAFFAARPPGAAWPARTRAAAPGPGTARAIVDAGVPGAQVVAPSPDAPSFDSEQLWALLRNEPWAGREVLVVRGEAGRDWLADQWRGAGARLRYLAAYARRAPVPDREGRRLLDDALAAPGRHLWLFSSSEAVQRLVELAPGLAPGSRALATHPRIAEACRAAGFAAVAACAPKLVAVLEALRQLPVAAARGGHGAPPRIGAQP